MDVCGIGSALVDILVEATPAQVTDAGLIKGSMQLMELDASARIHAAVPGGIERSGGSCANTIAGVAALGGGAGFIGRVAGDHFGQVFATDLDAVGVQFGAFGRNAVGGTGRCLILVTPDGDRTMCTTLGVASHLGPDDLDGSLIEAAHITYLEGYLWDEPEAIAALRAAIEVAHVAGRRVALTLSDAFCVERHRDEWAPLIASEIDILFGNEAEVCSLTGASSVEDAIAAVRREGLLVTVTLGPGGALAFDGSGPVVSRPAAPVDAVVDTTGAGDLYAAGFLFGLVRDLPLAECVRLGTVCAGECISHIGARPETDLAKLISA